ncbi:MAG: hypothetical protein GY828_03195 [Candidatus Gracilibacteria bacterium]|nr:hypothetical protein [Candidatus Gracilibacteria bacterium]
MSNYKDPSLSDELTENVEQARKEFGSLKILGEASHYNTFSEKDIDRDLYFYKLGLKGEIIDFKDFVNT